MNNWLEQLAAEWYEYQGYLIRRNRRLDKAARGGYHHEYYLIAYCPKSRELVHVEAGQATDSWAKTTENFKRKFAGSKENCCREFEGLAEPVSFRMIALLATGSRRSSRRLEIPNVETLYLYELFAQIVERVEPEHWWTKGVPEQFPTLRTIQALEFYR